MQRSASALYEAGNTIDESIALITGANSVIQNPEQVGTALKTLALRLRGAKTELEEAGEDVDGMAESTSQLQKKLKALTHGKVDIMLDADTFKNTTQILREMSGAWEEMTDIERAAALELMGGKRQANILASVIKNFDTVEQVITTSMDASGSAIAENEKYLDSIQGKINQFKATAQTMWANFLDDEVVKRVIDFGTVLIKLIDTIGLIPTALGAFAGFSVIKSILSDKELTLLGVIEKGFVNLGHGIVAVFKSIKSSQNFGTIIFNLLNALKLTDTALGNYIIGLLGVTTAQNGATVSTLTFGAALKKTGAWLLKFLMFWQGLVAIAGIAIVVATAYKTITNSHKYLMKELEKSSDEYAEEAEKLKSLNNELTEVKSKIDELESQGPLNFTEQEDLNRLKETSSELERQIKLQKQIAEYKKQEALQDFNETFAADNMFKEEYVREGGYNEGAISTDPNNGRNIGTPVEQAINNYTAAREAEIKALEELDATEAAAGTTEYDQLKETYEAAKLRREATEQTLGAFKESMATYLAMDGIQWTDDPVTTAAKEANENIKQIYNALSSIDIAQGISGAKSDTIDRLLGDQADDDAKKFKEEIEEQLLSNDDYLSLKLQLDEVSIDLNELYKEKQKLKDEAESLGVDLENAIYGNIDTDNRHKLMWTDGALQENKERLMSWFGDNMTWEEIVSEMGDFSTVFGGWDTFGEQQIPIAFSPILQTPDGPKLLHADTVHEYINMILEKAMADGAVSLDEVLKLDAQGIGHVKGLIADMGDTAEQTAEVMHFTGSTGAIASISDEIVVLESTSDSLLSTAGDKIQDVVALYPGLEADLKAVGINVKDLAGYFTQTGEYAEQATSSIRATVSTLDTLTASVEAYKNALSIVNNITFDGQAISEDYYNTLKEQLSDITVAEEGFSDAIKEQNGKYLVKNAALLQKLVAQSRNAKRATIEVARAQTQLQYRNIVNQIRNSVMAMGVEYQAYGLITDATFDNISAMREQIDVLKQTIQEYALLEIGLSGAARAYDEYEAAKERDAKLSYDDSFLEMLKTIDEGLLKNETGTEAFQYAVKAVVDEDFYEYLEGIENVDQKVRELHDYVDGHPTLSRLFYVDEESGEFDINADNVREFIDLAKEAKLITGDSTGFSLAKGVTLKDFVQELDMSEAAVLALLSATEKVDALWGNILTDVMTNPLERDVNAQVDALDTATQAVEDYWQAVVDGDEQFNSEKYAELQQKIADANAELDKVNQIADSNAQSYSLCQAALSSYRGELSLSKAEADALARSLGFVDENGQPTIAVNDDGTLQLADDQIGLIAAKLKDLEEPAVMRVQLRYDEISEEINQLKQYIQDGCTGTITIDGVEITNQEQAQAKIDELTPEQKEIQLTYGITETSTEEEKSVLESYQELAKNGLQFTITVDATQANDELTSIDENNPDDKSFKITADGSTAEQVIKSIADQLANITDKDIEINVTEKRSIFETVISAITGGSGALGNAFASGTIGLKQSQNNAVVGELGQEMVVDPIRGTYYTVGDHGTEMIDLPKGAIIYNHKQTEELLKNGHTSRGKYTGGLAFAKGNAYADYGIPSYHPNLDDKTSFANGTDINTKWDDAVSTLSDAANNISDATDKFEEVFDWIEVRLEEIEEQLNLLNAQLENAVGYQAQNPIIDATIELNEVKLDNLEAGLSEYEQYASALLTKVPAEYRDAAQNGAIAIEEFAGEADEATLKAIQDYREWAQKAADVKQQIEEIEATNAALAKQKFDNVANQYDNQIGLIETANDKLDAQISLMEDRGYVAAKDYYEAMMGNTQDISAQLVKERDLLQQTLDAEVKAGRIKVGSDDWYDAVQQIYDVDAAIVECTSDLESFQNAINDIYWDNFDQLINRYDYLSDETQNLIDLMDEADMVTKPDGKTYENGTVEYWTDDDVKWTDEGMASLGLYAQQMEIAEAKSKQYAKAIDDLSKDYKAGKYSENEYLEKLNELKNSQYDAIESYHDARKAIKDLNATRIESVKEGLEKEIEAYEELIDKKKEELDAEKDLHDFQKSVMKQQKDISELERKLAAISNDHSISAMTKRKQLEAELAEARAELEETYYDRSIQTQQEALDQEKETFRETKEEEITQWEEYLDNIETVVADSLLIVQENAVGIGQTLTEQANEYNLTLSDAILTPWQEGKSAIDAYSDNFGNAASATTDQLNAIKVGWQEVIKEMEKAAELEIEAQERANKKTVAAQNPKKKQEDSSKDKNKGNGKGTSTSQPSSVASTPATPSVGQTVTVKSTVTHFSAQSGGVKMASFVPGGSYQVMQVGIGNDKSQILIGRGGTATGWVNLHDLAGYAKGTLGVEDSQFAWLDELGEELVMHADGNGRLSFLTKGTSVIPADITKNLMQLGQLNPQDILDRSRPSISAPHITNNNIELSLNVGEVVHIDTVTNETIPNLTKAIEKQMDKYMKQVNSNIRKYAR